jgi:hypothetical protein
MDPRIRIQKNIYGSTTLVSLCIFKSASLLMSHTDACDLLHLIFSFSMKQVHSLVPVAIVWIRQWDARLQMC